MNNLIIDEMLESEESGEMRFHNTIRDVEDEFNVLDFVEELNKFEEQRNKIIQDDDIFLSDNFIEELDKEMELNTCPEKQKKNITQDDDILLDDDFIEELNKEFGLNNCLVNTNTLDIYDGYNKLVYQGEEYFVKKKNIAFPVCVMNSKLVQVGIIREDDINNIVLL